MNKLTILDGYAGGKGEDECHHQIAFQLMKETSKALHLELTFVACWKLYTFGQ
jgi:hypothetical protein